MRPDGMCQPCPLRMDLSREGKKGAGTRVLREVITTRYPYCTQQVFGICRPSLSPPNLIPPDHPLYRIHGNRANALSPSLGLATSALHSTSRPPLLFRRLPRLLASSLPQHWCPLSTLTIPSPLLQRLLSDSGPRLLARLPARRRLDSKPSARGPVVIEYNLALLRPNHTSGPYFSY